MTLSRLLNLPRLPEKASSPRYRWAAVRAGQRTISAGIGPLPMRMASFAKKGGIAKIQMRREA
jgi:hypothetical protein